MNCGVATWQGWSHRWVIWISLPSCSLFLIVSSSRQFARPRPTWWFASPVGDPVLPALSARNRQDECMEAMGEGLLTCPVQVVVVSVRILGVDDWAWKKGQTYGTILVDLEKRCPIELLPDRKEETLTAWLLTHPEIEVISRDRGGEYAAAGRKGAPQAQQIADTFHLLQNLRHELTELMARKQKVLPEVEEVPSDEIPLRAQGKRRASALSEGAEPSEPEKRWRSMSKEPRHSAGKEPEC